MSTTQPPPLDHVYIILRTNYQRLPNNDRGYTYTSEDPIALSAHPTYKLALEALLEHKRFITHNDNGEFMARDYAMYMLRNAIDGVDIILTPRSHAPPIEVRLRVQGVDVEEDKEEKKRLADVEKQAEADELARLELEENQVGFGRGPMEMRRLRPTWRGAEGEGQDWDDAAFDDPFYSDLETELGREVPRRFRGHSIHGSVRTVKWKMST